MEVGSAYNYEQLLDDAKQQALAKIGGDKLAKISGILGQAAVVNAELSQFGFYKTIGNLLKEKAANVVSEATKPATPLGTEGTALKDFQPVTENPISEQVQRTSRGVFGKRIIDEQPEQAAQPSEEQFGTEDVADRPVVPTEQEGGGLMDELISGARSNLASDVEGMTQSIRGSLFGRASQLYDKAVSYKQSLDSGIERISSLRNKATEVAQQLQGQAKDLESQGKAYLQQGQEMLARGEQAGQDIINQGQGLLNKSLEQAQNSELFQTAMDTAKDKIFRGQQLLDNGDNAGMKLLQEGQDQLEQAQSTIKGYGQQAKMFGEQIQTEIESRTQQLNDLAENLMSQSKSAVNTMSDIGNAVKSGDVEGAVQGIQSGIKQVGQVAEGLGIEGGEEIASGVAEAIPVVGEVVSAGLLLASLFTGFSPHERVAPTIETATQAYGL